MNAQRPTSSPTDRQLDALLSAAREVRARAHVPYSRFPVGAALLSDTGAVYTGCNVENASYGLTLCAERVAVGKAVSEGSRSFRAIAVAGPDDGRPCHPCGSCRQVLHELSPDLLVITAGAPGEPPRIMPLRELLPHAFGPDSLASSAGGE